MKEIRKILLVTIFFSSLMACNQNESTEAETKITAVPEKENLQNSNEDTTIDANAEEQCYEQKFGTKGKENIFRVSLREKNDEITGLLEYLFYGEAPIAGSIIGKKGKEGAFVVLFNYVQEGRAQYQKVYFKKEKNRLLQKSGELIDVKGVMDLKDPKANYTDTFILVPCLKSFI